MDPKRKCPRERVGSTADLISERWLLVAAEAEALWKRAQLSERSTQDERRASPFLQIGSHVVRNAHCSRVIYVSTYRFLIWILWL